MGEKIKLIWDFRGQEAEHFARHHAIHLREYAEKNSLKFNETGSEELTPNHHIAFLVVHQDEMISVRDHLKPHRGQQV
ncbi:MAG: hypothetical protein RIC15_06710 [Vicingaceae bacterium]